MDMEVNMFHPYSQTTKVVICMTILKSETIQLLQYLILAIQDILGISHSLILVFIPMILEDIHIDLDLTKLCCKRFQSDWSNHLAMQMN